MCEENKQTQYIGKNVKSWDTAVNNHTEHGLR